MPMSVLVTARVRSTTGDYVFPGVSLSTQGALSPSHNTSTGPMSFLAGTPVPAGGGGGTQYRVPPSQVRMGRGTLYWGPPHQGMGYPPTRDGVHSQGWDTPQPGMGYPPGIGQQREYLLRGGRYASCVHAGGLSCYLYCFCSLTCANVMGVPRTTADVYTRTSVSTLETPPQLHLVLFFDLIVRKASNIYRVLGRRQLLPAMTFPDTINIKLNLTLRSINCFTK